MRSPDSAARRLAPIAIVAVGSLTIWLAFGHGFANYDTFYPLVWGGEIASGQKPDYGGPIAPTPHPLATALGVALSPFGDGAEGIVVAIAFLSLATVVYLTYRLGTLWFGVPAGLLAAAIVLTREPMLSEGARAYVDVPYIALVLGALLIETRRPRAGWPVLAMLAVAGLLRPEAWLFSGAYLVYLYWGGTRDRELVGLAALAASAPLVWFLSDLWVTGNPLYSFTDTRDKAESLNRATGIVDVITVGPRRLGEIVREPVLVGAVGGGLLALAFVRSRARVGIVAGVLAVAAFALLGAAGLSVITRYLLLTGTIVAIFCGAGAFGWQLLPEDHPWRRRWFAFGVLVLVLLAVFVPSQADRLSKLQDSIAIQERIRDDLHDLADSTAFAAECDPVSVPNHRPVPLLALWLDRRPSEIVSAQVEPPRSGYYIDPASAEVEENFSLDKNDPGRLTAEVPPGFELVAENRSWRLFASPDCARSN